MISPGGNKKARQSLFFKLCAAGSFHSVLSTNTSLHIAGRNIGQFGSEIQNKFEFFTKLASIDNVGNIRKLVSSNAAIGLFVESESKEQSHFNSTPIGDIFLLEKWRNKENSIQCERIVGTFNLWWTGEKFFGRRLAGIGTKDGNSNKD